MQGIQSGEVDDPCPSSLRFITIVDLWHSRIIIVVVIRPGFAFFLSLTVAAPVLQDAQGQPAVT
jgi:hypothetical protein